MNKKHYVVWIYNDSGFLQIRLPAVKQNSYMVFLSKAQFGILQEECIFFEWIEERWFVLLKEGKKELLNQDLIKYKTKLQEEISLFMICSTVALGVIGKYQIPEKTRIRIGQEQGDEICFATSGLPRVGAVSLYRSGQRIECTNEREGYAYVDGKTMEGMKLLSTGNRVELYGLSFIILEDCLVLYVSFGAVQVNQQIVKPYQKKQATLVQQERKNPFLLRAPRNCLQNQLIEIEIEAPPLQKESVKPPLFLSIGPSMTMMLPMLLVSLFSLGARQGGFVYTGLIMVVTSAGLSVMWSLVHLRYGRKKELLERERRQRVYREYVLEKDAELLTEYRNYIREREICYPAAEICCTYQPDEGKLWNRNWRNEDYLFERLGIGTIPSMVQARIPPQRFSLEKDNLWEYLRKIKEKYQWMRSVPVGIDLKMHRLIGLIGGQGRKGAYRIVHNLLIQIAAGHSCNDLKVVLLANDRREEDRQCLELAKWLPHVWEGGRKQRYLAGNQRETMQLAYTLGNIFRRRWEHTRENGPILPHYVVFILEEEWLEDGLLNTYLFEKQELCGITTLYLVENREELPNECSCYLQNDAFAQGYGNEGQGIVRQNAIQFDRVTTPSMQQFARRISGCRVKELSEEGELPEYVPLLQLFGHETVEQLQVEKRWRKNSTRDSMKVPIGMKAGGIPWNLDIHEKAHGPHGLIAGTTGAGKSEILQTFLLSLAVQFSPLEINFLIIDYKGGGMGNLLRRLPHMAGMISNLSGNQIRRAMIAIKSENRKRQVLFNECGVNNISAYTDLFYRKQVSKAMPHLLIVIDEFAELKKEEPEFMRELISVAQVGRSLGVHLILATQKPAGTVDDNIRSNSRFKLCLRVQDRQDSMDMLHKPDAAYLTGVGRCYMQVGNDEVFELFQTGYSGAGYCSTQEKQSVAECLTLTGERQKIRKEAGTGKSQMEVLIDYLEQVSIQNDYSKADSLWMAVLPTALLLNQLKEIAESEEINTEQPSLKVAIGLCDDPGRQRQFLLQIDIVQQGSFAVCGGPLSGKSTLLQTFLYALFEKYDASMVNAYLLDYSTGMLAAFREKSQVGGIYLAGEESGLRHFFSFLEEQWKLRKKLLAGGNYVQYCQKERENLPVIVVVIDNYSAMREQTGEQYETLLLKLIKEGAAQGIYVVVSAMSIGAGELPVRMAENMNRMVALEMSDKYKYAEILRTYPIPILPEAGIRGRGMVRIGEEVYEFQTALAIEEENDFLRMELLQKKKDFSPVRAKTIPQIPEHPTIDNLLERNEVEDMYQLPVGYEERSGEIHYLLLKQMYCYLIAGKRHSGKKNLIKLIKTVFQRRGIEPEILMPYTKDENTTLLQLRCWCDKIANVIQKRKEEQGVKTGFKPLIIIIEDMNTFLSRLYAPDNEDRQLVTFFEMLLEQGNGEDIYWFAAYQVDEMNCRESSRFFQLFAEQRCGIFMGGNATTQQLFDFTDVSYGILSKTLNIGCGWSKKDNQTIQIVIPKVTLEDEENDISGYSGNRFKQNI